MKRISIDLSETPPFPLRGSTAAAHSRAGSALKEFLAGRLGAPGCWPDWNHPTRVFPRLPDDLSSIQRWENDGGKTVATPTLLKGETSALLHFHPTHPLLTQLI